MKRVLPGAIVLAAIIFYVATLAPGLLWGDSAKFQRMAWQTELRFDETGHPLWVILAHPLTRIPGLDPAGACNLFSAALSSLALWPAFRIMRRLGASSASATLASLALAVSHTFWFHAVMAEVYALNSLVTLALLDLLTINLHADRPGVLRPGIWLMMGLIFGMTTGNHLQALLWLPGYLWWMRSAWRAGRLERIGVAAAAGGFVAGLAPFALLRASVAPGHGGEAFFAMIQRLLSQALMPSTPARDAAQFVGYLLYQFPVPLMLVGAAAGLIRLKRERPADMTGLLILYATNVLFAFSYQVPDRFAFYLPSYLVLALAAAPGFDVMAGWIAASPRSRAAWFLVAFAAGVIAPPLFYSMAAGWTAPGMLNRFPGARPLPGRDPVRFHLYPGKTGYDGARRFCLDALTPLPSRAFLIADYTLNEPLNYTQIVYGVRPDVEVTYVLPVHQLERALDLTRASRRVYLAAADRFYDIDGLSTRFEIRPSGPIYELVPR